MVPIESKSTGNEAASFDAAKYVDALWDQGVPKALAQAVDLGEFVPNFARDAEAAGAKWGRSEGIGPYHVIVRGTGQVTAVDVSSRTGIASLKIAVPGGTETVQLQIGPVLRGTSIRDALPSVSFNQFVNQIQFADVANELNARVERELLASLEREALEGRQIRVTGMVTLSDDQVLTITPVRLEVGGPQ
jgi:predicted lipoprotein